MKNWRLSITNYSRGKDQLGRILKITASTLAWTGHLARGSLPKTEGLRGLSGQ